jgi:Ni/Fe-hydrogenase subunit HybB-like protein
MGGVILNRFNVTWFVMSPVDGEVYVPHWMEVAILAGVVAGIVLVYSLIARYFPVYEETVRVTRPAKPKLDSGEGVSHAAPQGEAGD